MGVLAGKEKKAFMYELGQLVALGHTRKALMAELQALPCGYSSEEGQPNRQIVSDAQFEAIYAKCAKVWTVSFEESQKAQGLLDRAANTRLRIDQATLDGLSAQVHDASRATLSCLATPNNMDAARLGLNLDDLMYQRAFENGR